MAHRRERQGEALPPTSHQTVRAFALGIAGSLSLRFAAGARALQHALDPKGAAAERIADLSWLLIALGTIVFIVVTTLIAEDQPCIAS